MQKISMLILFYFNLFGVTLNAQPNHQRNLSINFLGENRLYHRSFALVIGISNYTHGWSYLKNPINDALEVKTVLEAHGFEVTMVTNPTSEQLRAAIRDFIAAKGLDPENRIIMYYAGHGHSMKRAYGASMGYIIPADTPLPSQDKPGFVKKAIDMKAIENYAQTIESKHALFIFDSCFSGSIFSMERAAPAEISYKTSLPVRQFITAGQEDEPVPDVSIFKQQLIEALQGEADLNNDRYVTGTELGAYLQKKVSNYSQDTQHPQYGKIRNPRLDKGDFVFQVKVPSLSNKNPMLSAQRPARQEVAPVYQPNNSWEPPSNLPKIPPPPEPRPSKNQVPKHQPEIETPKITSKTIISLRKYPKLLSEADVKRMITENNFYHRKWNSKGSGIQHRYEQFEQSGNLFIFDRSSGLMWQQSGSKKPLTYKQAIEYITHMNEESFAGFSDWRLPTLEEAMGLIEPVKRSQNLFLNPAFDQKLDLIHTADRTENGQQAWVVDFSFGDCYIEAFRYKVYVRAVRSVTIMAHDDF